MFIYAITVNLESAATTILHLLRNQGRTFGTKGPYADSYQAHYIFQLKIRPNCDNT